MDDKHPKRPRDLNQWAKRMVDLATGEVENTVEPPKSKAAKAGSRGGKLRAAKMTAQERSEVAKKAANARWGKGRPAQGKKERA